MDKVLGIKQKDFPRVRNAAVHAETPHPYQGIGELPRDSGIRCFSPFPYPYGRDYNFGYMYTFNGDEKSFTFTISKGTALGNKPFALEEKDFKVIPPVDTACQYLFVLREDTQEFAVVDVATPGEFESTDLHFMIDDEGIYAPDTTEATVVDWRYTSILYSLEFDEQGQVKDIVKTDSVVINTPEVFTLRSVTEEGVTTIRVYAPKDRTLFYLGEVMYYATATSTWDDEELWIDLPFSTGDVYAYIETDDEGSVVSGASVKFSQTEVLENAICIKIGDVTAGVATNVYTGAYAITGATEFKTFPWKVYLTSETVGEGEEAEDQDVVNVVVGRVYELGCLPSSTNEALDYSFDELTNDDGYDAGDTIVFPPQNPATTTDGYLVIAIKRATNGGVDRKYSFMWEELVDSSFTKVQRVAKYVVVEGRGTIEQIHMGDVSITEKEIAPFTLAKSGSDIIMYLPAESIILNGKDFTSEAGGLSESSVSGWYTVTSFEASGLMLYVLMDKTDGQFGKPISPTFGTTPPTHLNGETLTFRILKDSAYGLVNVTNSAIVFDIVRGDGQGVSSTCKSISTSAVDGLFTDENHTIGLHGFRAGTSPDGAVFDAEETGYTHKIAVREVNTAAGKTELRWVNDSVVLDKIEEELLEDEDWITDLTELIGEHEAFDFWTWYDGLTAEEKRFWEKGADYSVNYGSSIGDSSEAEAINLDDKLLKESWIIEQDLQAKVVNCKEVNISSESGVPGYTGNLTVAGTFQYQGKNINLGNDGLVYWSD